MSPLWSCSTAPIACLQLSIPCTFESSLLFPISPWPLAVRRTPSLPLCRRTASSLPPDFGGRGEARYRPSIMTAHNLVQPCCLKSLHMLPRRIDSKVHTLKKMVLLLLQICSVTEVPLGLLFVHRSGTTLSRTLGLVTGVPT